ncbi:MAG TPA: DUF3108 domain-containing protein [Sulfurimonas sp.]|nr:DUF3108 domain-containing protein [Sulfurimonas sp.]
MKIFFSLLLISSVLLSNNFSTRYDVNVGVLGKVGHGDIIFTQDNDQYEIRAIATLTGMAATLTGNRFETYISTGHIVRGKYLPDTFVKIKKTTRKERIQTYTFDHKNKMVRLLEKKSTWVSQKKFDPIAFKILTKDVKEKTSKEYTLDNYMNQDVLSAYFNALKSCTSLQQVYDLKAVGAHNKDQDITITFLEGEKFRRFQKKYAFSAGNIYHLHVEPFDKKEDKTVDVIVLLDEKGYMKKAVLGNVFWVGEVTATRVKHRVTN